MQKKLTLQQLVHVVWEWFRQLFDEFEFWVEAEIADIKPFKSRLYCELIQANDTWAIIAQAKWIIREPSIMQKFLKSSWISRSELVWTTVLIRWVCTFHVKYGRSISIREVSAEYTRGKQVTHRDKVINQLKKEWLRQINKTTHLPYKPLHCAVITWRWSAWYEDFASVLSQSWFDTTITPHWSAIDGNKAVVEVAQAMETILNQLQTGKDYDCIVIVRWWWAKDGFLWQDDYGLWKLIANSPIPILIAIWHTRDQTLLDQTVYHSAKTPTDAAYVLLEHYQSLQLRLEQTQEAITINIQWRYTLYSDSIEAHYISINQWVENLLDQKLQQVEVLMMSIDSYNPISQLQKWWWIVTDAQWMIQKGKLNKGSDYTLHHGATTYTITVQ